MPVPDGNPSKLLIKANAFLTPKHPIQEIEVFINGVRVSNKFILNKQQDNLLEVMLPLGMNNVGDPLTIEFRSLNAISPKTAGLSADDRNLGIGLISIQFAR